MKHGMAGRTSGLVLELVKSAGEAGTNMITAWVTQITVN